MLSLRCSIPHILIFNIYFYIYSFSHKRRCCLLLLVRLVRLHAVLKKLVFFQIHPSFYHHSFSFYFFSCPQSYLADSCIYAHDTRYLNQSQFTLNLKTQRLIKYAADKLASPTRPLCSVPLMW